MAIHQSYLENILSHLMGLTVKVRSLQLDLLLVTTFPLAFLTTNDSLIFKRQCTALIYIKLPYFLSCNKITYTIYTLLSKSSILFL